MTITEGKKFTFLKEQTFLTNMRKKVFSCILTEEKMQSFRALKETAMTKSATTTEAPRFKINYFKKFLNAEKAIQRSAGLLSIVFPIVFVNAGTRKMCLSMYVRTRKLFATLKKTSKIYLEANKAQNKPIKINIT
jgi:hypothetical protein